MEGPQVRHYRDWINRFTGQKLVSVAGERAGKSIASKLFEYRYAK